VAVRADFHEPIAGVKHEIIITPKMSFGTGHHATTFLMIQLMQELNLKNTSVFDFGTGTGILAILAEKEGAEKILAVDYDEWCILNAAENLVRNHCTRVALEKADSPPLSGEFDVVLANINKNIILFYIDQLESLVRSDGSILLSGLLTTDEPEVLAALAKSNMKMHKRAEKNGWIALHLQKSQLKN
jgi:ribosomal protein L11 methyltransferase